MPAYDFRCDDCGQNFTAEVPLAEKEHVRCPKCGCASLKQLFTGLNFMTPRGSSSSCSGGGGGRFT